MSVKYTLDYIFDAVIVDNAAEEDDVKSDSCKEPKVDRNYAELELEKNSGKHNNKIRLLISHITNLSWILCGNLY